MPVLTKKSTIARCACGSVRLDAVGAPILTVACYCDDCQEGGRRIEALPNARPVLDSDGGSAYLLYRKDRMGCSKGADLLRDYRLNSGSSTRRVVAACCNSAMFLDFEEGHWFSLYRVGIEGEMPPVQMRIQTRFRVGNATHPDAVPGYATYPVRFVAKLVASRVAMLLRL